MSPKAKPATQRIASSGSGGPGTFRGIEFQTDYAILKSLYLIHRHLYEPLKASSITVEPRLVHSDTVTRWDIRTDPPPIAIEAKANLTKGDLQEFLQRAGEALGIGGNFGLVSGRSNTTLLNSVMRLQRLAMECGADHRKFDEIVRLEEIPDTRAVLEMLGPRYREILPHLVFEDLSEKQLKRELEVRSRDLFPEQPDRLVDFISKRFTEGATCRKRYEIDELVDLINRAGMTLVRPAEVELSELPPSVRLALAVLQAAPKGLPREVVAAAAETGADLLQETLSASELVSIDQDVWRIRPFPFQIAVKDREDLLCRALSRLLDFLHSHETDKRAEAQLLNAISLSRECLSARPDLALPLFQETEHIVKNLGNKHLLLEISNLCIDAGRHSDGGNVDRLACVRARAQAMLCGISWVLQRTDRLREARSWAEKSLQLGQDIGWDRNTAFANKCLGRLDRMEAEHHGTPAECTDPLLQESATKLQEAIQMFSNSGEFGPTNRQVGDCYSLLARTYLTARNRGDTEDALRKAYEILPSGSTKEYFDLLILDGDYEVAWGSRETAEDRYTDVVGHHSKGSREHSEIYARALSKRADSRAKLGKRQPAILDTVAQRIFLHGADQHEAVGVSHRRPSRGIWWNSCVGFRNGFARLCGRSIKRECPSSRSLEHTVEIASPI